MNPARAHHLFRTVVYPPLAREMDWGNLIAVEGDRSSVCELLDTCAGIDWIARSGNGLVGIAVRVQDGGYETFSIRAWIPSGGATELEKRLDAHAGNLLKPQYQVQAYFTGDLLRVVYAIHTFDLYAHIATQRRNGTLPPLRDAPDGAKFLPIPVADLRPVWPVIEIHPPIMSVAR